MTAEEFAIQPGLLIEAATMMGARRVLPANSVADALRQIEYSRRLIQQSRTAHELGCASCPSVKEDHRRSKVAAGEN